MNPETLSFFDLNRDPFTRPASHADMYMDDVLSNTVTLTYHCICDGEIFALTGPIGSGKSLLIDRAVSARGVCAVHPLADRSRLTISHIHTAILSDLTGALAYGSLEGRARMVQDTLLSTKGHVVLVLDDAHLISSSTLSGLRALHEICGVLTPPLSIALVGLPALSRRMEAEVPLHALRARTAGVAAPHVNVEAYITHKIEQAGGVVDNIFTRDGLHHFALTGVGVPLEIEQRAQAAMEAAADVREKVSAPVVRHVEKEAA